MGCLPGKHICCQRFPDKRRPIFRRNPARILARNKKPRFAKRETGFLGWGGNLTALLDDVFQVFADGQFDGAALANRER